MRAMPGSTLRAAVAIALLALVAAPLARAAVESSASAHACCPERRAPRPVQEAPCQQIAPTSCCLEVGVPPAPNGDAAVAAPVLAFAAPASALPPVPTPPARAVPARADGPPLRPLARTGVLLL